MVARFFPERELPGMSSSVNECGPYVHGICNWFGSNLSRCVAKRQCLQKLLALLTWFHAACISVCRATTILE